MLEELSTSLNVIVTETKANLPILLWVLLIPWAFYLVNLIMNQRLLLLGIQPRRARGLIGIIFAPFLHGGFNHLFFNSIPLIVLSNFILIQGVPYFFMATILITILSGFAVWCFAKRGLHIGASAVITGYWGLLVSDIYQQGSLTAIILGIISLYYFAGIFLGIFPGKKGVSWEGHLFGLFAGITTSFLMPYFLRQYSL
jgi:membrane associated rhomboid family serine protease